MSRMWGIRHFRYLWNTLAHRFWLRHPNDYACKEYRRGNLVKDQALAYLRGEGLQGTCLRDDEAAAAALAGMGGQMRLPSNPLEPLTLRDVKEVADACIHCDHRGTTSRNFYLMAVMLNARAKAALLSDAPPAADKENGDEHSEQ